MAEVIEELAEELKDLDVYDLDEIEGLNVLENGSWEQDGKMQFRENIVSFKDKSFRVVEYRSGSYHTDWNHEGYSLVEVKPITEVRTITTWDTTGSTVFIEGNY